MPLYEYECAECGPFTAMSAMSTSGQPSPCPICAEKSARILSAVSLRGTRAGRPRRGRPEPRLVKSDGSVPAPAPHVHRRKERPWMMGH